MRLLLVIPLFLTLGCASSLKKEAPVVSSQSLEGLSISDLANLDKKQFLIELNSFKKEENFKRKASLVFLNPEMSNRRLNLNTINLKFWLRGFLNDKGYILEKLHSKSSIVIVVDYGISSIKSPAYEQTFGKSLSQKTLTIKAYNYQDLKKEKSKILWEGKITNLGPEADLSVVLPVMASFLKDVMETNVSKSQIMIPHNDPKLELTKEVPTAIPIDDYKPSIEELNLFN